MSDERGPGPEVLVVDDEPALLRATARCLRSAGYTVTECASGPAACRLIAPGSFAVVVSDIDMPDLSGIDLLRLLRERGIDIPVVLVTGGPTLDTAMKAVEHGAFKYLPKPVDLAELRATVAKAVSTSGGLGSGRYHRHGSPESSGALPVGGPGAVSVTRAGVVAGAVLGERYRLRRLLGEGGMSQVWEAEQLRTGRDVAVKLLSATLNARAEMRKRLLREARAANEAGHPNIADVFDVFELADGTPVLAMALLRGRTLKKRLAEGPMSLPEAADLFLPIVSAVGAAHARGVVHRDLKPDNVFLVTEHGGTTVKVLDFGVAKLVTSDEPAGSTLTATGAVVGTPGYMSPEQCMGEADVDHRADVWAIGVMLYEALSGVRPVPADSVGQMLKHLFTEGVAPLSRRVQGVPSGFAVLVDRCLLQERDERPGDLREVYDALVRHARTSAPPFGPPATPTSASSRVRLSARSLATARTEEADAPVVRKRR